MTEAASKSGRGPRTSILYIAALVVIGVLAFASGYLSAGLTDNSPQDPALGLARDIGDAIPLEQHWAFQDGVITGEEVAQAGDNFRDCVQQAGVEGFVLTINENGWDVSLADNDDFTTVATCQNLHFQTTYDVYRRQQLPTGE